MAPRPPWPATGSTLATKMVNELVEAADEEVLTKTIARYGRVDRLAIDELGYRCNWTAGRRVAVPDARITTSTASS
ncbi:hypothetical protein ACIPJS_38980 [Streptomyces sp. NPDC086783]|uniref:hypothetical protein n=1 Tax=Streptomyces sp. NPDC086783 TaxID=3365758 RepID=UPI00381E0B9B